LLDAGEGAEYFVDIFGCSTGGYKHE